ncbi:hypothetical protein [Pseudonocardia kunmingensis]|uniref:Uncharacterized protein n=1 Tax=Pseudonocardia kunmingensis TaxID=630975 RepID=A0A543DAQ2_9PSEU|nr:hypothetical protein [Pseudonocardia kunmingensis]TQM06413.1 hypothetical protein FB558_6665 [Pseudonocardia kunmingensis]
MNIRSARQLAEIGAPGAVIGVIAGAVLGVLAGVVGQPLGWALTGAVMLAVPLAFVGGCYGVLTGLGHALPGMFTPAALLWLVGFPLSRLWHETMTPVVLGGPATPPDDVVTFLLYQALVSMGFAIGFIWLYERIIPGWLSQIKDHNPYAERVYARYIAHAEQMWNLREQRRARRRAGHAPGEVGTRRGTPKVKAKRSS